MVYVTGDTHGDLSRFSSPDFRRLRKGDTLIVLGDFGFLWSGDKSEQAVLRKLSRKCKKQTLLFLDGPHENFDLLRGYPTEEWNGGHVQVIAPNIFRLMRGDIYTIEGETYFVFGGGQSPEHEMRMEANTWWEEEMPSAEEMLHGRETLQQHGNKVDYILTHTPSGKTSGYISERGQRQHGLHIYLNTIEESVDFGRWFFASTHADKTISRRYLSVFRAIVPVKPDKKRR